MLLRFLICVLFITTSLIAVSAEDDTATETSAASESSEDNEDSDADAADSPPIPIPPRATPHVSEQRHASIIHHLGL